MWLIAIAASGGNLVAASEVELRLRAAVANRCHVRSMRANATTVEVVTNCNANQVSFMFDAAGARLRTAASNQATVSFLGNQVLVRPYRPGSFTLRVRFDTTVEGVSTELRTD